jgi:hypothetical protein
VGHRTGVETYAVGFARPDHWGRTGDDEHPWHAVEAHRPVDELDGEVELAVCGAIVQVWGWQKWERVSTGRTACADCRTLTAGDPLGPPATTPSTPAPTTSRENGPRLRIVS